MRVRWLPIVLGVSLLANVGLAIGWVAQLFSEAVLSTDTGSTFRWMASERSELRAMRRHFCPDTPAPDRAALLAWEGAAHSTDSLSEPFEKDGLLWLGVGGPGVKFDADDRLVGVCLAQTWGALDDPPMGAQDRAGELCPLEPLC